MAYYNYKQRRFYYEKSIFWNDDDDAPWYDVDDPYCEDGELNDPFSDGELEGVLSEDLGY